MQEEHIPALTKLLDETSFDDGYESAALFLEQSSKDANTTIEALKINHYNAVVDNYEGLGKFARVVLSSLGSHKRFLKKDVTEKLKQMLLDQEIKKGMISDKLYEKIS